MKRTKLLSLFMAASLLTAAASKPVFAAADKSPAALVAALFETYGGKDHIRGINGMRLHFAGEIYNPWQSRSTTEASPISNSYRYAFDWAGQREVADTDFNFPGGHRIHTREIKNARQSLIADMTTQSVVASNNHYRLPAAIRFHPILLMRELARDDVSVQGSGSVQIHGVAYDVLSISRKGGPKVDLLLTQGAVRIGGVRYKSWAADNESGTATQLFSDEDQKAPHFPRDISGFLESAHPQKWHYRIEEATLNPPLAQEEFSVPTGFAKGHEATPRNVTKLGKGIHLVSGLQNDDYNALVLEFKDFIAIVEAPIDHDAGEELRKVAKQLFPTKRIKYLVLSHHHADHIGGASALIEPGTEIIAPASSKSYIEAVLKARKVPSHYTFRGLERRAKYSIGDDTLRVDVHALYGNPHADDMLFVHVPGEKLIFQADMFFFHEPDYLSYPLNERGFAFYHSLLLLGLDFTHMAGTHGVTATRQRVEKLIGHQ